jgi:hypothetical protein
MRSAREDAKRILTIPLTGVKFIAQNPDSAFSSGKPALAGQLVEMRVRERGHGDQANAGIESERVAGALCWSKM